LGPTASKLFPPYSPLWRPEGREVRPARACRLVQGAIDFQNFALGAVLTVSPLFAAPQNRKSIENVVGVVTGNAVKVEKGRV
jgi:hypothetical protein